MGPERLYILGSQISTLVDARIAEAHLEIMIGE